MARTKLQMQDISDVLRNISEAFQAPELVTAPFTQITDLSGNARKLPDPSKTVKPLMGIERIHTKSIKSILDEKGPNGEPVYGVTGDERIRFYGALSNYAATYGSGPYLAASSGTSFVAEITFYGTGLNLLAENGSGGRILNAFVDGTSIGDILPDSSSVISARNYAPHVVYPVVSNLTLGLHTVRLEKGSTVDSLQIFGFDVINNSTTLKIPQGKVFNKGKSQTINVLQSLAYDSGFAVGSPNGRGGRVVIYTENGELKKAIQPVDAVAAYAGAANHTNEELIRRINFREFGANRADDFSTLTSTTSTRAYTLDDGITTLVGVNVAANISNGLDTMQVNSGGSFFTITFVGTGLDIVTVDPTSTTLDSYNIVVDGVTQATGQFTDGFAGRVRVRKAVSGLPYGTHTVQFVRATAATNHPIFTDFLIYGPKKPSLPEGAVELGEYYLMGNFSANTVQSAEHIASGVLRKVAAREMLYVGGSWTANLAAGSGTGGSVAGVRTLGAASGQTVTYTFFGTGFEIRMSTPVAVNTFTVSIDGSTNLSAYSTSFYGQFSSFVAATGVATSNGSGQFANGLRVSGLPLGIHTVVFTQNGASSYGFESLDIITPVHFPNSKVGSLSVGPGVEIKKVDRASNIDLSKAKAWLVYDGSNNILHQSYNISGVLRVTTGQYTAFFETPFKTDRYSVVHGGYLDGFFMSWSTTGAGGSDTRGMQRGHLTWTNANTAGGIGDSPLICLAFFGQLEGEE